MFFMANISNDTQRKIVYGTSSGDYIKNTAAYATVYGYEGDDTVYNTDISHWSVIDAGEGNDSIYSYQGNYLTISGGAGDVTDGAKLTFTDCADKTVLLKNTFGKTVKNGAYYGG